jgi:hypothetical protein
MATKLTTRAGAVLACLAYALWVALPPCATTYRSRRLLRHASAWAGRKGWGCA